MAGGAAAGAGAGAVVVVDLDSASGADGPSAGPGGTRASLVGLAQSTGTAASRPAENRPAGPPWLAGRGVGVARGGT